MIAISIGIILAIIGIIFGIIDYNIKRFLHTNADKYKNHPFQDRDFPYANWAKGLEVVILLGFALLCLLLLFVARDMIDVIVLFTLAIASVSILIYRSRSWKYEFVMLKGNYLIYNRGKKRKTLMVNLHEVEIVYITYFRFLLHMKDNRKIKFPVGFKKQSYMYGILKYHRP